MAKAPRDSQPRDDVDEILAAWRRERPDIDVAPMEILSRVWRLARRLDRVRKQAFADQDLETWEFDVLSALRRAGTPYELSPGHLVAATLVTSGTMTNRVDRLADRGFVTRHPAPGDRRGILVRLTPTGRSSVDRALDALLAAESDLIASLAPLEQAALTDALKTLTRSFEDSPSSPPAH
jgi:DNA-binding MarR family transcriptional regulator